MVGTAPTIVDVALYVLDANNLVLKDNRPQISLADPDTHSLDSADGSVVDALFVENNGEVKLNTVNTDNTAFEMLVLDGSGNGIVKRQLMQKPTEVIQLKNITQTNLNNSTTGTNVQYNVGTAINTDTGLFSPTATQRGNCD